MLVFGSALYGSAEDVHDGDILNAGTNISVTKDETTKTITISTDGVATSAEVDAVKTDVQKNQTAIADNTGKIKNNTDDITELKNVNSALGLDKTKTGNKVFPCQFHWRGRCGCGRRCCCHWCQCKSEWQRFCGSGR